jgi:rubrerythrin
VQVFSPYRANFKPPLEVVVMTLLQNSQKSHSDSRNPETMQLVNSIENQAMINLLNINASGNGNLNTIQKKRDNRSNTGLPTALQSRIEAMSGMDMSGVKVHYNSSKPAGIGALAYTQGDNINVAPNQEKNLPHEAWHVVQQKRGVVKPNTQLNGVSMNDDDSLEHEADVMGDKSIQAGNRYSSNISNIMNNRLSQSNIVQMCHSDSDEEEEEDDDDEEEAPQEEKEEKDDPSFVLPSEKSKDRHTFPDKLRKQVIKQTAPKNKDGLYVCQGCGHPLAEGDLTEIKTWYDSKSDKRHDRKSADLDHVPPWSIRHDKLVAKGAKEDIRKEHDDPKKLRALCYRCNQKHAFEGRPLPSVDRSGEEYESSDEERDKKIWKRYRRKGRSSRSRSPRRRKSKSRSRSRSRSSRSSSSSRSRSPRRSKKDK